jgi:hypothetical protein
MKKANLLLLFISVSTVGLSQNAKYSLNKVRTSQILEKYSPGVFEVYTVISEDVPDSQTKKYMRDYPIDDVTALEGEFIVVGEFYIHSYDSKKYTRNQLVERSIYESSGESLSGKDACPLFYSSDKNEYYLDAGHIKLLYECGTNADVTSIIATINKAGFKTSDSNGDYKIQTANGNLTLTADIVEAVKNGNTKYITELSSSVKTFNQLMTESKPLVEKLAKHYSAHRAGTMTNERLAIWKQEALRADGVLKKMTSLKGAEKENIVNFNYQLSTDALNQYNEFWGVVNGSKQVLGL